MTMENQQVFFNGKTMGITMVNGKTMGKSMVLMGKFTISMAMFNVELPESKPTNQRMISTFNTRSTDSPANGTLPRVPARHVGIHVLWGRHYGGSCRLRTKHDDITHLQNVPTGSAPSILQSLNEHVHVYAHVYSRIYNV